MAVFVIPFDASLWPMRICAGVVIPVSLQKIDCAPNAEAGAEGDDQRLEHVYCGIEKCHK